MSTNLIVRGTRASRFLPVAVAALVTAVGVSVAGPLTPPAGPVSSTSKTLQEVEPRIAINSTNTPGDVDSLFRISQSGSYYLTGNLVGVSGKSGIEVAAAGVTIDFMGFTLTGVAGSLDGIKESGGQAQITLRNGSLIGWGGRGVMLTNSSAIVEGLSAGGNASNGIDVGTNSVVRSCIAKSNTLDGIQVGTASVVVECSSAGNGGHGISANSRCTVSKCAAEGNTGSGIVSSFGTLITECSSGSNTLAGISVSQGCTVSRCQVSFNTGDGISTGNDGLIIGNACDNSGNGAGVGAGILASSSDNRIEGNSCTDGDYGIRITASGNIVMRNTCAGNITSNWEIAIGNAVAPIVTAATNGAAISGNTYAGPFGSTDPHANFTY
ncbi:MAG: hypothetical protein ACREJO_13775 [Phycisphaerales bacterium]